ncbi:MAG TPA: HEAT repeat domain-containing protein [Candidatus Acidoferrum sp.]|nr:HEAT repeat domain-containing protein [Candidatus Acidoferrum sp.]
MTGVAGLATVLGSAMVSHAQQAVFPPTSTVSVALTRMQSKNLRTREAGFDELMTALASDEGGQAQPPDTAEVLTRFFSGHPSQAEQVKVGLIRLLEKENKTFITDKSVPPGSYTEDDSEYYASVIDAVSSLNDDRTIPALVGAMTTGGMAQRGLLKYGDKALGPVLEQLKNPDALVRASALGMSITLLEARNDPESHKRTVDLIRSALADSASVVRAHAVREIGCLNERQEFVPTLENIAKTDPEKFPGKALDGGDGEEFYPVRYDAQRVLRDIQSNKTCRP